MTLTPPAAAAPPAGRREPKWLAQMGSTAHLAGPRAQMPRRWKRSGAPREIVPPSAEKASRLRRQRGRWRWRGSAARTPRSRREETSAAVAHAAPRQQKPSTLRSSRSINPAYEASGGGALEAHARVGAHDEGVAEGDGLDRVGDGGPRARVARREGVEQHHQRGDAEEREPRRRAA